MLKPKRKIGKKELKQDALVTTYAKVTGWYAKNSMRMWTVLVVVLAVTAGFFIYATNESANTEQAAAEISQVFPFYDRAEYQLAIDGVEERDIRGLRSIVEDFGETAPGQHARFYLASSLFHLEQYEEALTHFEDFKAKGELLSIARLVGMAGCHESMGQPEEAGEYYEQAAAVGGPNVDAARNLNRAARSFALAGNKEKAIELYRKLKKNYPTTTFGREADRYISQLSV